MKKIKWLVLVIAFGIGTIGSAAEIETVEVQTEESCQSEAELSVMEADEQSNDAKSGDIWPEIENMTESMSVLTEEELIIENNAIDSIEEDPFVKKMAELEAMNVSDAVGNYSVTDFGGNGADGIDDTPAFIQALETARISDVPVKITVPAGTYYINKSIAIYSDTTLVLDKNALVISTATDDTMLYARHLNADGSVCRGDKSCTHGGYSQIQNVTIQGGVWNRNDKDGKGDNSIFCIRHGKNITIKDLTCKNCTNHHLNLSGVDTALIQNVKFLDHVMYTGKSINFWKEWEIGDAERYNAIEAVHLDYITDDGEPGCFPNDGTASRNITIQNCTFKNVFAGVGTHHFVPDNKTNTVVIKDNKFYNLSGNCVNACGFDGMTVNGNVGESIGTLVYAINSNFICENNSISKTVSNVVYAVNSSTAKIIGNDIIEAGAAAIRGNENSYLEVQDNTISHPAMHGISVSDESKLLALNNTIVKSCFTGICGDRNCQMTIRKNTIESSGIHGIAAADGTVLIAENNVVNVPENCGIYLENGCNGSSISDNQISDAKGVGIMLCINCSNGEIIRNTIINAVSAGIGIVENSTGCIVKENTIKDTIENGIYIYDNSSADITENSIKKAGTAGIRISQNCQATVQKNIIESSGTHGISAANGTTLSAVGNTITNPGIHGIFFNTFCDNSVVTENQISGAKNVGIMFYANCKKGIVTENTIEFVSTGISIVENSTECIVKKNIINNTVENGIYINDDSSAVLSGNNVTKPGTAGIRADQNCQITADENTVTSAGTYGISVANGSILTASKNTVKNPKKIGIFLSACKSGSKLDGNTVEDSGSAGIYVYCTLGCTVTNNTVKNSGGHGIHAAGTAYTKCTVTVKGNTAVTKSQTSSDICLGNNCKGCIVQDNVVGDRGFTAADPYSYTGKNNVKTHQHVWKEIVDKKATCASAGSRHKECSVCGKKQEKTVIKATGKHTYGSWKVTKEATVFAAGQKSRSCTVCQKTETAAVAKLNATIRVSMTSIPLKVKQSYTIKVEGLAKGDKVKSWESSDKKIAAVNSKGKIIAKKKGSATVTVELASGLKKKIAVKVQSGTVKTTKIRINVTKKTLENGKNFTLKVILTPQTSQQKVEYSTSNKEVATVNSKGVVKGKKKGTAVITVTSGSKKVKCKVTIK